MIESIYFEYCKSNGDCRYIHLQHQENEYILNTGIGQNGLYMDTTTKHYSDTSANLNQIIKLIEVLHIPKWDHYYPVSYRPVKNLTKKNAEAWSLDYKEKTMKRFRHIKGQKKYPPQWFLFIIYLDALMQEGSLYQWIKITETNI